MSGSDLAVRILSLGIGGRIFLAYCLKDAQHIPKSLLKQIPLPPHSILPHIPNEQPKTFSLKGTGNHFSPAGREGT